MSRAFPYPLASPAIAFATAMSTASFVLLFMGLFMRASAQWTGAMAALLFAAVFAVYGSPLLTEHLATDSEVRIRYGLVFRADVPMADIEGVRPLAPEDRIRGALDLSTEKSRRVAIRLRARRRFPHAPFRSTGSIVVSVNDVEGFVESLRAR